jgi:hypothetical protein
LQLRDLLSELVALLVEADNLLAEVRDDGLIVDVDAHDFLLEKIFAQSKKGNLPPSL